MPKKILAPVSEPVSGEAIVLFTHPGGQRNWSEEGLVEEARERFGRPVEHHVVERA